jgi:hypothetical protein
MADANPPGRDTGSKLRVLVFVSLGLNLFLGGYWVGEFLNRSVIPPRPGPGRLQDMADRLRGQLGPDAMRKIDRLVVDIDEMFRNRGPAGGDVRSTLRQVISESRFDQEAFLRTVTQLSAERSSFDSDVALRIAAVLSELSERDRQILADVALRQFPPPPPGR